MKASAPPVHRPATRASAFAGGGRTSPLAMFSDQRPQAVAQRRLVEAIQRQSAPEEEELLQGKFPAGAGPLQRQGSLEEEELHQGKFAPMQRRENTTGMPDPVKARMETALGADFSDVRIHARSPSAPRVGALAYTQGSDVHFAPGQFKPDTAAGRELLGHELTHVVQQRQGQVRPTTQAAGLPVNDEPHLEREADRMGREAARTRPRP